MPEQKTIAKITPILKTNTGVSRTGWRIDYSALEIVRDIEKQENLGLEMCLNIQLPIVIRFSSAKSKNGSYACKRDDQGNLYHRIILVQNNNVESVNETLWHELTHCHQAEAWADAHYKTAREWVSQAYSKTRRQYWNNPYEIQAREVAAANKTIKLLKEV